MKKNVLEKLILLVLLKSIIFGYAKDTDIKSEIDGLTKPFVLKINILPFGPSAFLKIHEDSSMEILKISEDVNLLVEFKNIKSARSSLLGKENLADSFSKHNILVKGDISNALIFVRVINKIESYLFPRFITKKINLPKISKQFGSLKLYSFLIFGKQKQKEQK